MRPVDVLLKFFEFIRRHVRRFDLFSQNIMFTYKGESSFSTFLGGLVSLIILVIVAVYFGFLVQVMVNRQNSNNSLSTEVVNLSIDDNMYKPVMDIKVIYNELFCCCCSQ